MGTNHATALFYRVRYCRTPSGPKRSALPPKLVLLALLLSALVGVRGHALPLFPYAGTALVGNNDDAHGHAVLRLDSTDHLVQTIDGSVHPDIGNVGNFITGIVSDITTGNVYVGINLGGSSPSPTGAGEIVELDPFGTLLRTIPLPNDNASAYFYPGNFAVLPDASVLVGQPGSGQVVRVARDGTVMAAYPLPDPANSVPIAVAYDFYTNQTFVGDGNATVTGTPVLSLITDPFSQQFGEFQAVDYTPQDPRVTGLVVAPDGSLLLLTMTTEEEFDVDSDGVTATPYTFFGGGAGFVTLAGAGQPSGLGAVEDPFDVGAGPNASFIADLTKNHVLSVDEVGNVSFTLTNSHGAHPLVSPFGVAAALIPQSQLVFQLDELFQGCVNQPVTHNLTIFNNSAQPVSLTHVQIVPDVPALFNFTVNAPLSSLPLTLPPGGQVVYPVTFNAQAGQPTGMSGNVEIDSTDVFRPKQLLSVFGTILTPKIDTQPSPGGTLAFGGVALGESRSETLQILNAGVCPLTIQSITTAAPFSLNVRTPITLAVGQNLPVTVTFTPTGTSPATGSITISADTNVDISGGLLNTVVNVSGSTLTPTLATVPATSVSGSPGPFDLGAAGVGKSITRSIQVVNNGDVNLVVSATAAADTAGGHFTVAPGTFTVAPGGSVPLPIRFAPAAGGASTGTITLTSNDPASPTTIFVSGTGITPSVATVPAGTSASPSTALAFGSVPSGATRTLNVQVINSGSVDLTLSSAALGNGGDPAFSASLPALPTVIAPGASVSIPVSYSPTTFGASSGASLLISTNATNVSGAGNIAIPLTGSCPAPSLGASPAALDFGGVVIGVPVTRAVQLTNSGGSDLTISDIHQKAPVDAEFTAALPTLPLVLHPGASVSVPITVTASSFTAPAATLQVVSNDPSAPSGGLAIPLTASVLTPHITLQNTPVDFGTVALFDSAAHVQSFTVLNTGAAPLSVTGVGFSPSTSDFALVETTPTSQSPLMIAAGGSVDFHVRFTPSSTGSKSATIVVNSNDPASGRSSVSFAVTGATLSGATGDLAVPAGLAFPATVIRQAGGQPIDLPLAATNSGQGTVRITGVSVVSAGGDFELIGAPAGPVLLGPGETVAGGALSVRFHPAAVGRTRSAQVVFSLADPVNSTPLGTVSVPVAGEGVNPGSRLLVTTEGAPAPLVHEIQLERLGTAGYTTILTLHKVAPTTATLPSPQTAFTFHAEVGGAASPAKLTQLRPGTYRWVVKLKANQPAKKVPFAVGTGTFATGLVAAF